MAFGTLKFDTLTTSDAKNTSTEKSIDTSYVLNGVAKSWWQYDQANTTTDGSFNVSSISDDSTGIYTPTLINSQSSITDRCVNLTTNHNDGETNPRVSCLRFDKGGSYTTSAITAQVWQSHYYVRDCRHNFGSVLGGLA